MTPAERVTLLALALLWLEGWAPVCNPTLRARLELRAVQAVHS